MASADQAIKKLKMNHLGLYTQHDLIIPLNATTTIECKKKKHTKQKTSEYMFSIEQ